MNNIKIISIIGSCDLVLFSHFIDHYISLGIQPKNFILGLHCAYFEEAKPLFRICKNASITPKILWTGPWYEDAKNGVDRKKELIQHLQENYTEPGDWLMFPDADEHYEFFQTIPKLVRECEDNNISYVRGYWVDRVARSGQLVPVVESVSLSKQFPIGCVISKELFGKRRKSIQKVMLAKRDVEVVNGGCHDVRNLDWRAHSEFGFVHHFKWNEKIIDKLGKRAQGWYASDGFHEALTFQQLIVIHGRIPLENLVWRYDFENPTFSKNILYRPLVKQISLNRTAWRDISWVHSFMHERSQDPEGHPLPWFTFDCLDFIQGHIDKFKGVEIFEYGSGNSTLYFAYQNISITSVEHERDWFDYISAETQLFKNVHLLYRQLGVNNEYAHAVADADKCYDIIIIDGRDRVNCLRNAIKRLTPKGVIIFDDSERKKYEAGIAEILRSEQFARKDFVGVSPGELKKDSCTTIFFRPNNIFNL